MKCLGEGIDGRPLSTTARTTLMLLLNYVNPETGYAWPSQETLASELRRDVRTVKRAIKELTEAGYVRAQQQAKKGKKFGSNHYWFLWRNDYAEIKRKSPTLKATRSTAEQNREFTSAGQKCPTEPGDTAVTQNSECLPITGEPPPRSVVKNEITSLSNTAPGPKHTEVRISFCRPTDEGRRGLLASATNGTHAASNGPTNVNPTRGVAPGTRTSWVPTPQDAIALLAVMQEITGGGDLGYSRSCLSGIKRGAGSIEDIVSVVRARCTGRTIGHNGYIKQVIKDQFGETVPMRENRQELEAERAQDLAAREKARRAALEPLNAQAKCAASNGDRDGLAAIMAKLSKEERRLAA